MSQSQSPFSAIAYRSDLYTPYGATDTPSDSNAEYVTKRRLPQAEIKPAVAETPRTHWLTPFFCEFMGVFVLAFTVAACPKSIWTPTAIAGAVVALIYIFFPISGAQLNPAVSLASLLVGKTKLLVFAGYVVAQVAGGVLAILLVRLLFHGLSPSKIVVAPVPPFNIGVAVAIDMLYTVMLAFVSLSVSISTTMNKNHFYAIAVGFTIIAASYASRDISVSFFNPALALAFSWYGNVGWCTLFALFELGGGLIAALIYRICRHNEYTANHMLYEIEAGERLYDIPSLDPPTLRVRMLSECLGTCYLILTCGLNTVLNTGATAWATAAAYAAMIYSLATVSGAHFNPAVTFGVLLSGRDKYSKKDGWCYALAQIVAAILVGLFVSYVSAQGPAPKSIHGLFIGESRYAWYQACIVEALFTFLLVYVVLTVTVSEAHTILWPSFYFALAVGFIVAGASYAAGDISGGYLNPAVALSFSIEGQPNFTSHATVKSWPAFLETIVRILAIVFKFIEYYLRCLFYWIPELVGACMAAGLFRIMYSRECKHKMVY